MFIKATFSLLILFYSVYATSNNIGTAAWQLDNSQSTLSFISIKKTDIAEVHHFTELSGDISTQGAITFSIDLNSVRTNIDIRDERMKTILFQTNIFPHATFSAQLPAHALEQLAVGETKVLSLSGELALHGDKAQIETDVVVVQISPSRLLVTSKEPIIVNAKDFSLVSGIDQLQALAGLPSISNAVPVSFVLMFDK